AFRRRQLPAAERLCRTHLRPRAGRASRRRARWPRWNDRLGRAGADGGSRRTWRRRLLLRAMGRASGERAVTRPITSLANPAAKAARALHMKKAREETGQFLAEGLKIVTEAV